MTVRMREVRQANAATHQTRMSDSSLYDEVCVVCGARDFTIGPDEIGDAPCPGPPVTVEWLVARGYRRVSHAHRMVARIDRPDWKEALAAFIKRSVAELYVVSEPRGSADRPGGPGYEVSDRVSPMWCDFYRRMLSKDVRTVSEEQVRRVPGSNFDPVEYVDVKTVCDHAAHAAYGWSACPVCNPYKGDENAYINATGG